jgi:TP901 family phage tail tape measure protein
VGDNYSVKYVLEAVDNMSRNIDNIKNHLGGLNDQFNNSGAKAKTFSQHMQGLGRGLKSFGNQMRYVSLALTGAGVASIYSFANMEKGLVNVQSLMSKEEVKRFTGDIKNMQKSVVADGFSIEDTNKALFDMVSALGINEKSSATFMDAHKLAVGGVTTLGVAVDGITSIVNAYGRELTTSNDVANAFFSSQKLGKTTVELLATNVGKVAPLAKTAGIGFKELLSTMSALTLGGLSTEESATALRGALSALIDPPREAVPILQKLGITFGVAGLRGSGLRKVLSQVVEANKKYPQAVAAAIPNIRAFTGLMALSSDKLAVIDQAMKLIEQDIKNNTGLTEAYNAQQQTLSDSIGDLWGNLKLISSEFGEVLAPYVKLVSDNINDLTSWFSGLNPETKKMIVVIGGLIAVVAPLAIALGTAVAFIGFIGGAAATAVGAVSSLALAMGTVIAYWEDVKDIVNLPANFFGYMMDKITGTGSSTPLASPTRLRGEDLLLNSTNMSMANVNVNLNAPKGTIKNYTSATEGSGLNLGVTTGYAYGR